MTDRPLIVFDFDGVIVDGMAEYWWSACQASQRLLPGANSFPIDVVPEAFRRLRPWVHHGWEMVLLAAELPSMDVEGWLNDYECHQGLAMQRRGWHVDQLQAALDQTRRDAVQTNHATWLALHRPYPGLVERLSAFEAEDVDWAVLTTKSEAFTTELLQAMGLRPWRVYGREAGAKPDVLLQLQEERPLRAFVEDRRTTLETVRSTPGLECLSCLLVSWGYLKPSDRCDLPEGIHLMDPAKMATPLAQWP
tara:strand:- start:665 stop:1414 length:750 start_codon:yes stop_codon:yes gene_type:complete